MKKTILKLIGKLGYDLTKKRDKKYSYLDIEEEEFWTLYKLCKPYSMTSVERMYSLYTAVEYTLANKIEGAFVECGVWRGGSVMLMAQMLVNRNMTDRRIFLYDTFEGMSEATSDDVTSKGDQALLRMNEMGFNEDGHSNWCLADLTDVKNNLSQIAYPKNNLVFVKGKVEDTIPGTLPSEKN